MDLDVRLPIGLMFSIVGVLLAGYGLAADARIYQEHSLGSNVNLGWGIVLLLFGALMLALAIRGRRLLKAKKPQANP